MWDLGEPGETRHRVCGVTRHPAYREESVRDRDNMWVILFVGPISINNSSAILAPKYQELY